MDSQNVQSPLPGILKNTIMPWVEREGMLNIFTAEPAWQPGMELPEGMTATHKPLRGGRVPVRGGRAYGGASVTDGIWPQDNLHSARTPKIVFMLTGPVAFQVSDYVLHCQPGHGILLPAGIPFSNGRNGFLDQDKQHRGFYEILQMMPYHGGLICWCSRGQQDEQGKFKKNESTHSVPHSKVPFYMNQLVDEIAKKDLHERLICGSLLVIAVAQLHREVQQLPVLQTGALIASSNPALPGQTKYSIAQAQQYIESNLREPLSIDRVSRAVCMSRTVFTAQFRGKTGKSFSQYLQDLRFEEARKLLKDTDLAAGHISAAVGLKPNRMRVLFHEREGISPLEFRRRSRRPRKK